MNTSKTKTGSPFTLRAPLLAFERVHRRTGTIRRTCTFHNPSDQRIELTVRPAFREHSWLLFAGENGMVAESGRLVLDPGDTRVNLLLNTDSSNFPYDRFRGRVYFQSGTDSANARWIEISFEEIEELQDFDGYAAIDLGTSNSILALYHLEDDALGQAPWNPELEAADPEMPSAVLIRDLGQFRKLAEGSCVVGRAALAEHRAGHVADPRCLQLGGKRRIGMERVLGVDAHGAGGWVDPVNVMQMLARAIRERAQRHGRVRSRLRRLMVTFPPTWDYHQIDRWKEVFRRVGFADEDLDLSLDEASAAGLFHVFRWVQDEDERNRLLQDLAPPAHGGDDTEEYRLRLLCFDFGGGTIDLALIGVHLVLGGDLVRMRVSLEGSDSLAFGGDQVTLATFRILKRRLALALCDPQRAMGEVEEDAKTATVEGSTTPGFFLLPDGNSRRRPPGAVADEDAAAEICRRWQELEDAITAPRLPRGLDEAVDALVPTRFWSSEEEPIRPAARQNFGWLWDRAEEMKRALFRASRRGDEMLALSDDHGLDVRGAIPLRELPPGMADGRLRSREQGEAAGWVTVGEIHACITHPLEAAVAHARRLAGDHRVDRIVLTGQSSAIPLVRRLFMRPRSEGGFGLAPGKILFDPENAKAAVSKGACLLRMLREALVGIDVDVSRFRANLLEDIFYRSTVNGDRMLFAAGPIDDLGYAEEAPDLKSFPRHLAVFSGSPAKLVGRFDFDGGSELADWEEHALGSAEQLGGECPTHAEFLTLDADAQREVRNALDDWPESARIAWMEASARPGTPERPVFRFYLSRNRSLHAVCDRGDDKRVFALRIDRRPARVDPADDPFSGAH